MTGRNSLVAVSMLALALCAGCGGGGGDGDGGGAAPPPSTETGTGQAPSTPAVTGPVPEGFYAGTTSDGYEHRTFVLDDGRYFMLFGPNTTGVMILAGMIEGRGQVGDGTFTSENLKFFLPVVLPGRLSIRFADDGTLQGNVAKGTGTGSVIRGGRVAWLDYGAPARVADVAGAWAMRNMSGNGFQFTVGADGALSGQTGSCSLSGTISPRASGKNVFDMSIAYGDAPCQRPHAAFSGIAVSYVPKAGGPREFFIAGTDTSRLNGFLVFGARASP